MAKYGYNLSKILEIFANGFMLNMTRDKHMRFKLHQKNDKIWHEIDKKILYRTLEKLRLNKIVDITKEGNIEKMRLNQKGKTRWLQYQLNNLTLNRKKSWDKKWRIVLFDIPENKKRQRDSLRHRLKKLDFFEFQKSVFVYPFPCQNEINFIINFFGIEKNVYYIEAPISPDKKLREHFNL